MTTFEEVLWNLTDFINKYEVIGVRLEEEYKLATKYIQEVFEHSQYEDEIPITMHKLVYYSAQKLLPPPKKFGMPQKLSGTKGLYKNKSILMLWYIYILKQRGLNIEQMRLHMYNYFSRDELPPKPVDNTPFEERLIYTLRTNWTMPLRVFEIEDATLEIESEDHEINLLPYKKIKTFAYEQNFRPLRMYMIPMRNLTKEEAKFISELKKDELFNKTEGFKSHKKVNGKIRITYTEPLYIFKKYPLIEKDDSKTDYKDLLKTNLDFDCL